MALSLNLRSVLWCGAISLAACGDESASGTGDQAGASDLEVAMSALENPIVSCQLQAGECVQKAADLTALQACQTGIGECLQAAGERVQQVAEGVAACREEQRKCLRSGSGQGGSCLESFDKCVQALTANGDAGTPSWPRADAGTPSFPGLGDGGVPSFPTPPVFDGGRPSFPGPFPRDEDASLPSFPGRGDGGSFPGLGDGGLPGFPPLGGFPQLPGNECLEKLRGCAAKPDAKLFECAAETRECLAGAALTPPFRLP